MNRYKYEITGLYNDWCKITKNSVVIHDGSLMGLIQPKEEGLILKINFGLKTNFSYRLRKSANFILGIPLEKEYIATPKKYIPIVFTENEFEKILEISYIDKRYVATIVECTNKELNEIWFCTIDDRPCVSNYEELHDEILRGIVAFSDELMTSEKLKSILNKARSVTTYSNFTPVSIYWDNNTVFELKDCLVKKNSEYYLKLDDYFIITHIV